MSILKIYSVVLVCIVFLMVSCKSDTKKAGKQIEDALNVELDTSSHVIKFENTLFSLPSPYQLSLLIKQIGADYNSELLNPTTNYSQYTSLYKKSLNLGVYGADLAYLNIYEQSPAAIAYFSVIKTMAQDLGLASAFSPRMLERIEKNIDNKDSLLSIMSNTYRDVDYYLKENQRQREGALVLAGGWIEAMYLLTRLSIQTQNDALIKRVGENKQPLENLIKILSPYYSESEEVGKLVDELIDLSYDYDAIKTEYAYVDPTTMPEQRLTIVHSKSNVVVTKDVLTLIDSKIEKIRNSLIK